MNRNHYIWAEACDGGKEKQSEMKFWVMGETSSDPIQLKEIFFFTYNQWGL